MTRALLAALALALVIAAPAAGKLPISPNGSSLGEGIPLKAYTTITPTVHLFGDVVSARLAIVADTKLVDPARLRVVASFTPYKQLHRPTVVTIQIGRFAQVTWTWMLRCLTTPCVPIVPPSDHFHVFRFPSVHITYLSASGRTAYGIDATWPRIEAMSQVSPGVETFLEQTHHLNWRFHLAPVAAPTYRLSPSLLFRLGLGGAAALFLLAAALGWRWFRVLHPARTSAAGGPTGTPLERALALLAWAHARGDETLQRKALERVAGELPVETPLTEASELSRTARELAWSARTPEDDEVETFSERARVTGRTPDAEETPE